MTAILEAGVAGITAVRTLYDQGITYFLLLEALKFIGGRMKQTIFADINIGPFHKFGLISWKRRTIPCDKSANLKGHMSNYHDICIR